MVCLGYYGLAFNIGDLGSDLYLNFMLQSLVELPANILCLLILDRVGRKPVMVGSMLIGGIALIGTIFTLLYLPGECKLFYFDFVLLELYYELVILVRLSVVILYFFWTFVINDEDEDSLSFLEKYIQCIWLQY